MRILPAAALAAALLLPALGSAAPGAGTIDMTRPLNDERGRPGRDFLMRPPGDAAKDDPDCAHCPPLTLGHAIAHALLATLPHDDAAFEQKWARAVLAERIKDDPKAQLKAAEITVIEKRLGQIYGGIVLLQALPLIDPAATPPEVK